MAKQTVNITLADGKVISLESGRMAKQAGGAVIVRMGDTMVLCTVCAGPEGKANDFFPLTVEYREKFYAVGKIPGGYFKREAKPSDKEVLTCRIIDRPLRPMFPEGYMREVQIVCTVLSADDKHDADTLAVIGASAAIGLSHLPFEDQVAAVKVIGTKDGKYTINPTFEEIETADIELIVAGSATSICMVEGSSFEVAEDVMVGAILAGHEAIKAIVKGQQELISRFAVKKDVFALPAKDAALVARVEAVAKPLLVKSFHTPMLKKDALRHHGADQEGSGGGPGPRVPRARRRDQGRPGRPPVEPRCARWSSPRSSASTAAAPRTSAPSTSRPRPCPAPTAPPLFQRGETQALVVCTLGTRNDEQRVESLQGETFKNYMLHYNFPGYSVGEAKRMGSDRPPRSRPRLPGRARPGAGAPHLGELPLHHPPGLRHHGVPRLLVHGLRLRRHPRPHGRGRQDQGPGGRHRHGPRVRRHPLRDPLGHQRHRGSPRRHGLQGLRHRGRHHLLPDGHQAARPHPRDHAAAPSSRPRTAACTSSAR